MKEYYSSMDRGSQEAVADIDEIGITANPMANPLTELKAKIFHGANKVELGFAGQGKTNSQSPGPESIGRTERADIRELAMINEVRTSTHAAINIQGLSGLNQSRFDDHAQRETMDEIRKAIDFAAEATTGGAVVFHTGEVPRGMAKKFKGQFELEENEAKKEVHYIVDVDEQKILDVVKEDTVFYEPEVERDANNKPIPIMGVDGKPVVDPITDEILYKYKLNPEGDIKVNPMNFHKFKDEAIKTNLKGVNTTGKTDNEKERFLVKEFFKKQQFAALSQQLSQGRQYGEAYIRGMNKREEALNHYKMIEEAKKNMNEKEFTEFQDKINESMKLPKGTDLLPIFKHEVDSNTREVVYGRDALAGAVQKAREIKEKVEKVKLAEEFAVDRSTKAMAEMGMYAFEKYTAQIKKQQAEGRTDIVEVLKKNPIYLAPEAWQPEQYGSHPDEIEELVSTARKKMATMLLDKKKVSSQEEATKIAAQSIKATIDLGHLNTWKRFYKGSDDDFKKWMVKEVKRLGEKGIIGHVHLTDNFGYHDEHLSVGEGNAPIREIVSALKKVGINDFIAEVGSFNAKTALPDAWAHLSSPVHRMHLKGGFDSWTDIKGGYFGKTYSPPYAVGSYAPSNEFRGAPFYSGLGMEEFYQGGGGE